MLVNKEKCHNCPFKFESVVENISIKNDLYFAKMSEHQFCQQVFSQIYGP